MSMQDGQIKFLTVNPRVLKAYEEAIRRCYAEQLKSASLFLMLIDLDDANSASNCEALCRQIACRLDTRADRIPLANLAWVPNASNNLFLQRLIIQNVAPETAKKEIENVIRAQRDENGCGRRNVRIKQFGIFIPRTGPIICRSFAHGHGHYYRYRVAAFKLDKVPTSMRDFLLALQSHCPDQYFLSGPRASSFDAELIIKMDSSSQHPIVRLAQEGLRIRKLKSAHEDLEKYLLDSDPETIACEVPIWFELSEFEQFAPLHSNLGGTITGHIDILRYEWDGKIGIWDYKPAAADETKAHIQVFLYAHMLSKRSGLSLEQFRCGYFDTAVAFFFKPTEISGPSPITSVNQER